MCQLSSILANNIFNVILFYTHADLQGLQLGRLRVVWTYSNESRFAQLCWVSKTASLVWWRIIVAPSRLGVLME